MTEKVKEHEFIVVDYTGKLEDGTVFDTTLQETAEKNHLASKDVQYKPAEICIGEQQLLPGLDKSLNGKEVGQEFKVTLQPEDAFGKRDVKKVQMVPLSTFKEHKVQPQPGLEIDVDGERGMVRSVSGGRVIVNFNHPLAGRPVIYEVIIRAKITDVKQQILAFLNTTIRIPKDQISVEIKDDKANVEIPMALPAQFSDALGEKLAELVKLKGISFSAKDTGKAKE